MTSPAFEDWQLALIEGLRVARLATLTPAGAPHLVPVCYALSEGRFFIPIDEKPKSTTRLTRLRNIDRDPRGSLLFDRYDDDWTRLAWVRVDGVGDVLARGDSQPAALAGLRQRYAQYKRMNLEERPLIRITPTALAAWRWQNG